MPYAAPTFKPNKLKVKQFDPNAKQRRAIKSLYGRKWRKASKQYLRDNPLCVRHEQKGEVVAATIVDHIIPHKGDLKLFWRRSNWQSLCKPCHDTKTATEDGGFGR